MEEFNNNIDLSKLQKQIEKVRNEETSKEQKVARLIILIKSIEDELTNVEIVLHKIWEHGRKTNKKVLMQEATIKLKQIESLKLKLQAGRLNLVYTYI